MRRISSRGRLADLLADVGQARGSRARPTWRAGRGGRRGGRSPDRARSRSSGCPRRRRSRSAGAWLRTWTLASSQGTNSPFCQIKSACSMFGEVCPIRRRAFAAKPQKDGPRQPEEETIPCIPAVRQRLTYSNVIATIALFVALGGVAVAAGLPKNSVGPKQLKRGAVTAAEDPQEARDQRQAGAEVGRSTASSAANAVGPGNIGNGAVTTRQDGKAAVIAAIDQEQRHDDQQAEQRSGDRAEARQRSGTAKRTEAVTTAKSAKIGDERS